MIGKILKSLILKCYKNKKIAIICIAFVVFLIIVGTMPFFKINLLRIAGNSETFKLLGKSFFDMSYVIYNFKSVKNVPVYNLIIDRKDFDELNKNLPVDTFFLEDKYKKTQPAKFIVDNKEHNVEVRYRGDYSNHWWFEKKSWQIEFIDSYFENKKSIGLILPEDRLFFVEQFNNYRAKKLGLNPPESKFVILKVNGKSYGIYFEIEGWGKEFLEKSEMTGDTNFYGEDVDGGIFDSIFYWKQYTSDSKYLYKNYGELEKLINLLKNSDDKDFYRQISDLVNMDNFYRWNIHSMLAGGVHQDGWHNARLYFNNVIGKFEFIPWDVGAGKTDEEKTSLEKNVPGIDFINYNPITTRVLKNPTFLHERNKLLWEYVSDEDNLKDDLKFYDELYEQYRYAFYQDNLKRLTNKFFDENVAKHRSLIEYNYIYTKELFGKSEFKEKIYVNNNYNKSNNIPVKIELVLKSYAPLVLEDIKFKPDEDVNSDFYVFSDTNKNGEFGKEDNLLGELNYDKKNNIYKFNKKEIEKLWHTDREWLYNDKNDFAVLKEIESQELQTTPHYLFFLQKYTKNLFLKSISVKIILKNYFTKKNIKSSETKFIDANEFAYFDEKSISKNEFLRKHQIFLSGYENKIILPSGSYLINDNIIIPKNLELEILPGVIMYFNEDISLISYSPIKAIGRSDYPIKMTAQNVKKPWGVFAVIDAKGENNFEHVIVEYGGQAQINGSFISGELAFYYTDVKINNSEIRYATGDDGLNVKNAKAEIVNSRFYRNGFDGADIDFVKDGKVDNNQFIENGNDGLDISSSFIDIKNNIIKNSGDKCISVGEKSYSFISGNMLDGCNIGIAIKDLSEPIIIDNVIINNKIGIAAYQKKEIFGGSAPKVGTNTFKNNKKDFDIDTFSKIMDYK